MNRNTLEKYKSIGVDRETGRLIIISKCKPESETGNHKVYTFKMFELQSETMIYQIILNDKNLIGRLISGLYTLIGNHVYFNDDIIKIRTDLIEAINSKTFGEQQIFDQYDDIFQHDTKEQKVQCYMPLCND